MWRSKRFSCLKDEKIALTFTFRCILQCVQSYERLNYLEHNLAMYSKHRALYSYWTSTDAEQQR